MDAPDILGWTPMHSAAQAGHAEVVRALCMAGATVDATDKDRWTPLHVAAGAGHADVVATLRTAGATVNAADKCGWTPLHAAALEGHTPVVAALLTAGATVGAIDHGRSTPLHAAARAGHAAVVQLLWTAGASVDAADRGGATPLCVAARSGRTEAVVALLQAGAAVDSADNRGWTPMHGGAHSGRVSVVAALRKAGAITNAVNNDGWTPLRMAAEEGQTEVVGALRAAGEVVDPPSPADDALAGLHAAYNGFVANPETLTQPSLYEAVLSGHVMDVRGLRCAHQILVLADRLDVLRRYSAVDAIALQRDCYEHVYLPVLDNSLELVDKLVVRASIQLAARRGWVAEHHVSAMSTALRIHTILHGQMQQVYQRLANLEATVDNVGQRLYDTIQSLRGLQQQLRDKDRRARKVALVKSAVKLGVSLAPLVGGVLSVSVDVVATMADDATEVTAAYELLADHSDIPAALTALRHVCDARPAFSVDQQQLLASLLRPYESMEVLVEDLEAAARGLGQANDGKADGAAATRQADPAEDVLEEPATVLRDVALDHAIDAAMRIDGEDTFFAGVESWDFGTVAAKLTAYVTAGYPTADRESFAAAARAGAAANRINGAAVVRCATEAEVVTMAACLVGAEWSALYGPAVSVRAFLSAARACARAARAEGAARALPPRGGHARPPRAG